MISAHDVSAASASRVHSRAWPSALSVRAGARTRCRVTSWISRSRSSRIVGGSCLRLALETISRSAASSFEEMNLRGAARSASASAERYVRASLWRRSKGSSVTAP